MFTGELSESILEASKDSVDKIIEVMPSSDVGQGLFIESGAYVPCTTSPATSQVICSQCLAFRQLNCVSTSRQVTFWYKCINSMSTGCKFY